MYLENYHWLKKCDELWWFLALKNATLQEEHINANDRSKIYALTTHGIIPEQVCLLVSWTLYWPT